MVPSTRDDIGLGTWRRERTTVVRRAVSAPECGPLPSAIVAESELTGVPTEWSPHSHPMHELVWVRGGTLTSRVGNRIFTVPAGFGLWIPAGVVHGGRLTAKVNFCDAFFAPDRTPVAFAGPTSIAMTPLLESLLLRLVRKDLDAEARARTEAVVFDVLEPSERQFALALPGDPRIDAIAEALLDDPADDRGLQEWAAHLGLSDRTITRAFRSATGLSFAQWRQALRIHGALVLLSEGADVRRVSEWLGYAQPSTFIAAFRRVMRVTPGVLANTRSGIESDVRNPVSPVPDTGLPTA
ncbi:helix-turn-helix domain-containing protein [Dactylosporangium sp. CA-092794]|uniref:helix-turn-helix domain-containing protein n=1 Tax=Dactylosporangium sp. CA-092794 TaxID=3239929 RepID=UPI003D92E8A0